jgi:hypothetical protein
LLPTSCFWSFADCTAAGIAAFAVYQQQDRTHPSAESLEASRILHTPPFASPQEVEQAWHPFTKQEDTERIEGY